MSDSLPASARTPNEELAARVARALVAAQLVAPRAEAEVADKLATGTAREAQWCGWLEEALHAVAEENGTDQQPGEAEEARDG